MRQRRSAPRWGERWRWRIRRKRRSEGLPPAEGERGLIRIGGRRSWVITAKLGAGQWEPHGPLDPQSQVDPLSEKPRHPCRRELQPTPERRPWRLSLRRRWRPRPPHLSVALRCFADIHSVSVPLRKLSSKRSGEALPGVFSPPCMVRFPHPSTARSRMALVSHFWRRLAGGGSALPLRLTSGAGRSYHRQQYEVKVGIPEFLKGVGSGVDAHAAKLEEEIGDFQKLLVTRTLRLKKLGIPCKHRKLILKYTHKFRLGLWRPRAET